MWHRRVKRCAGRRIRRYCTVPGPLPHTFMLTGDYNRSATPKMTLGMALFCLALVRSSAFLVPIMTHGGDYPVAATHAPTDEPDTVRSCDQRLNVLEFYSGIGGMRVSLNIALARLCQDEVLQSTFQSFDINSNANKVYEHNFPGCVVRRRSIEHITEHDIDDVADLWLLRVGKQMDAGDNRSTSFQHLLSLLQAVKRPPTFFFLENVKGFESSLVHRRLLEVLISRGFKVEQYMLSPIQLGVPNTRVRYYCLASRGDGKSVGNVSPIREGLPKDRTSWRTVAWQRTTLLRSLSEYVDHSLSGEHALPLLLSAKARSHASPVLRFDIATLKSTETTTFTKGYGKHAGRAGPVLLLTDDGERRVSDERFPRFSSDIDMGPGGRELRWFSDREMLRLHGFPEHFRFPPDLTVRQRMALVGNSINVEVVALLLRHLFSSSGRRRAGHDESTSDRVVSTR